MKNNEREFSPLEIAGGAAILHLGDCLDVMRSMPDNSVDSIVTDPPYELGFMGKKWDSTGIANSIEMWKEALRVLKPGGHLLAFSGSRTYHRMTAAIEDAGFEIRDQIMWLYGSGFPKSHDVSKAIDKKAGADREVVGIDEEKLKRRPSTDFKRGDKTKEYGGGWAAGEHFATVTAPATSEAKQWQGWGTALKPAHEPICVARKPLIGTVAENVLKHGTGALNIDGCRIKGEDVPAGRSRHGGGLMQGASFQMPDPISSMPAGRWPANVIHDGSDEIEAEFAKYGERSAGHWAKTKVTGFGEFGGGHSEYHGVGTKGEKGSASRFFYCAKASKKDRGEGNSHPTVKPTELMAYLCRLVTPLGGTILDPFMGSGSTGKAAIKGGFKFIGIDMTHEYLEIAASRISHVVKEETNE